MVQRILRVLDLFAGLGGFSQPFRDRGHDVTTVDIDPGFSPTRVADIRSFAFGDWLFFHGDFDVILASPPCQAFSVAAIPTHWAKFYPDDFAQRALDLVNRTLSLIDQAEPRYWVLENPRGMLRKLIGKPKETVFLCSFGDTRMKPTDLWGEYPGPIARPCAPHVSAPRGSRTPGSTQGIKGPALRSRLPYGLGLELCSRMENDYNAFGLRESL